MDIETTNRLPLTEYKRKRNFVKTPAPRLPKKTPRKNPREFKAAVENNEKLRFVIQKHNASRLHYDFRLETKDAVLKSWAVPKGVSLNPSVKRLAVLTEDHPLDYMDFEGVIPKGNYGAGTVIVWDRGKYTTEKHVRQQFKEGKISFCLHGKKVRGSFSLVRMKNSDGKRWLLTKSKDAFASKEEPTVSMPESVLTGRSIDQLDEGNSDNIRKLLKGGFKKGFPTSVKPMLAMPADQPFDKKDWVFEVKWDGVRSILFRNKSGGILELRSRKGNDITHRCPEIANQVDSVVKCNNGAVLDGEIVVLNKEGIPDFQLHQRRMNVDYGRDINVLSESAPATYFVFDILYHDGYDLESLDFVRRRKILSKVIRSNSKRIRLSDYIEESGKALFEKVIEMGLEGVVAKYKYGKYLEGDRSSAWLKIKHTLTQDCVVIGYTTGEGNREGYFGSLILAAYYVGKLRFVGHVGSGFGFDQLQETFEMMQKFRTKKCPINHVPYVNRQPVWLMPKQVAEVKFNAWTQDKIMRAPIFVGFREDKPVQECKIEVPKDTNKKINAIEAPTSLAFSNLDKTFLPSTCDHPELKKRDLLEYYEKISSYILPHLRDRPLSLSRYPHGITGKSFYHKNWSQAIPDYAKSVQVLSESRNDTVNYLICNNKKTLLWLANLGCIEMHPRFSRVHNYAACMSFARNGDPAFDQDECGLSTPDFIIFDLDPYIYSGREAKGHDPE